MKKVTSILLALFLCLFVTACGQKELNIDTASLTSDLLKNVKFEDEISEIDGNIISSIYEVDTTVIKATAYIGSGATAEEIAVFEAPDKEKAKEVLALANKHIEEQKSDFESYNPKEIKKLNNAKVVQKDKYVIICVTDDENNASKVINKYLK